VDPATDAPAGGTARVTPELANRILLIAIALFVVIMLARVLVTHLEYRKTRREWDEQYKRVRRAILAEQSRRAGIEITPRDLADRE